MGRTCKKCGQQTGADRRLCMLCWLDKRCGNDFETDAIVACEDDSLERGEQVTVRRVSRVEEVTPDE